MPYNYICAKHIHSIADDISDGILHICRKLTSQEYHLAVIFQSYMTIFQTKVLMRKFFPGQIRNNSIIWGKTPYVTYYHIFKLYQQIPGVTLAPDSVHSIIVYIKITCISLSIIYIDLRYQESE